jgi:hypothetical protein
MGLSTAKPIERLTASMMGFAVLNPSYGCRTKRLNFEVEDQRRVVGEAIAAVFVRVADRAGARRQGR